MKIKLSKELLEAAKLDEATQSQIIKLSRRSFEDSKEFWNTLKDKYKNYNFASAKIDNETGELILPFQEKK